VQCLKGTSAACAKAMAKGLVTIKPTQLPQVKNGEHPEHSFLWGRLPACPFWSAASLQSLSAQHGLIESNTT
jgi:hypothetical protein